MAKAATAPAKRAVKSGEDRRPRGWLETDVKQITDKFLAGKLKGIEAGTPLTPHRIAKIVQDTEGLEEPPSTGAVAAVLLRWQEYGFANLNTKPLAFKSYTKAGQDKGLDALKQNRRDKAKADRAKAKPAVAKKAPAKKAPAKKAAAAKKK